MSKNRIFIAAPVEPGKDVAIRGERAHYIGRVLRLRPDDRLRLFDGSGGEFDAVITALARDRVDARVTERVERSAESPLAITLLQGLSRGDRMDYVIQKATELGMTHLIPVETEFSVVKLDARRADKRVRHWESVAASACEQCGRNRLPKIELPCRLPDLLGRFREFAGARLILKPGVKSTLKSIDTDTNDIAVLIGPEGGFSEKEYEHAAAAGFQAIGLGPRILRTETAGVAVLAALQALYGDLGRA